EIDPVKSEIIHESIMAIVVRNDSNNPFTLIKLGSTRKLKKVVPEFRAEISNPNSEDGKEYLKELSSKLYSILWEPMLPFLKGKKTVFIVPDGILNLVPMNALLNEKGQYLVQSYNLIHLSSARDIAIPVIKRKQTEPVIFAAPIYDDHTPDMAAALKKNPADPKSIFSGVSFDPLPGTAIEVETLIKVFKSKNIKLKVFSDKKATELNLGKIKSPKILHLATHGFFLIPDEEDNPLEEIRADMTKDDSTSVKPVENPMLRAGLALNSSNYGFRGVKRPDGTDGVFTALEALTLDLVGTDLVILSACETGVGDIKAGEGVYGLRRAFQEAGAKSVASTLWTISDSGTQQFMTGFYKQILEGEPPQKALREMQLRFINDEDMNHPFYWAPFVMFGVF
ncbi:MAG: CHAT domain-containing protein, partial [SAR324 cluster bacterium]|nr:CHAT domain-containing protein [SAR324 cluster bacterium]